MIKKLFGTVLVTILMAGMPAMAQKTSDEQIKTEQTTCSQMKHKHGKKKHSGHHGDAKMKKCRNNRDEFAGMTLTESQQTRLSDLKQKEQVKRKERKEQAKAYRKQMREERMKDRNAYMEEVRIIVGDENFEIYKKNNEHHAANMHKRDHKKDFKRDFKKERSIK